MTGARILAPFPDDVDARSGREDGKWDTVVGALSQQADQTHFMSDSLSDIIRSAPDERVLPALRQMLAPAARNRVIFVHLMGQHVAYANRVPKESAHWGGPVKGLSGIALDYANATKYGDFVVGEIIELASRSEVSSVVFLSDHGEVVEEGVAHDVALFGSGASARFEMVEIPLAVWLPAQADASLRQRVRDGRHRPFMTDDLPHLLFDLYGIRGDRVMSAASPINPAFVVRDQWTLAGRVHYPGAMPSGGRRESGATVPH